jgi:aspartyl-tRNA(Asn)/glutamyl-tRNA(Gln) amidotransferase subunit A
MTTSERPAPDFGAALAGPAAGLRVGVPWSFLEKGVDEGVMARFREALGLLAGAGATLVDVALPHAPHAIATYYLVATAEASSNLARYDGVRYGLRAPAHDLPGLYGATRDAGFGPEVKRRIILGTFVLSSGYYDAYYLRAQKLRTLIRRDYESAFASCDVVATPTSPTTAFRFGERTEDPLQMYLADVFTVPANLAGLPGISQPCGLAAGLPVGFQLVGRPFEEATVVRLARALERAREPGDRMPGLPRSVR